MAVSGSLRFGPLDARTVHLCIDMQNLFAEDTPWHTPWMKRVLPVVTEIADRHAERTIFTRFIPARHPDGLPGSWRRYYQRWADLTLDRIDPRLLELVPPCPGWPRCRSRSTSVSTPRSSSGRCGSSCAAAVPTRW